MGEYNEPRTQASQEAAPEIDWDKVLSGEVDLDDVVHNLGLMTKADEERGVHFGAQGAEGLQQEVSLDPVDRAIAVQLFTEGDNHHAMGSPDSIERLVSGLQAIIEQFMSKGLTKDKLKVIVHASCVTGDDCVVVSEHRGEKYHFNTRNISDYNRGHFMTMMERQYDITVEEKDV